MNELNSQATEPVDVGDGVVVEKGHEATRRAFDSEVSSSRQSGRARCGQDCLWTVSVVQHAADFGLAIDDHDYLEGRS
jgi:hypothetical protein